MKDNQSEHNMGEQIMDALSDALQGGDYSTLNRLVSQSVVNALNEVGKHISFVDYGETQETSRQQTQKQTQGQAYQAGKQEYRQTSKQTKQAREQMRQQEKARRQARQMYRQTGAAGQADNPYANTPQASSWQSAPGIPTHANTTALLPSQFKKVGNVSNVLYQIFGGIGLGFTALATFFHITYTIMENSVSMAGWIVNLLALLFFTGMIRLGIGQRRRLKLAERYAGLCGRNLYGEIEHLARNTGRKARRVIKDLQKMMKLGMFPEGHLDEKKTCFMLNDSIYQQYLETENNRRLREAEAGRPALRQTEAGDPDTAAGQSTGNAERDAELNTIVAEGMECIRRLRLLNDKITGEVISAKLFRLENLLKNLFDSVREHPEQMHRMHKLMSYYLPTTLKLVEAYEEFDRVSAPGDDIIAAKAEIENTLDTINQAFTELLNNLFQDAVLDATTDAQVLKTMLAREGLMNQMDFTAAGSDSGF